MTDLGQSWRAQIQGVTVLDMYGSGNAEGGPSVFDRIAAVLAPYLGSHMTKASIEMFRKQLGIGEVPTSAQEEELIARLERGLKAFVGEERTAALADEMRNAAKGDGS